MNYDFEKALKELEAELSEAKAKDFTAEIEADVAEFKQSKIDEYGALKSANIAEKESDIAALKRIIARVEVQSPVEEPTLELPKNEALD